MENTSFIERRVRNYYWVENLNCTITALKVLAEIFDIELSRQVLDAALGMHGAGRNGAQCGLVEGILLFLGIFGRAANIPDELIVEACRNFAREFEEQFSSLLCRELRPQGFSPDLPPHLCEKLTCAALDFATIFIHKIR